MSSSSSSVSSIGVHLASVAQAFTQQLLISRDRQIVHEESREAITHDSISCLPFDMPLVDPCGHTFDRETIKGFKKLSSNTVECPISRKAIRIDHFVNNLYAQNVLNYFGEEASRASVAASSTSASRSTTATSTSAGSTTSEFVPSSPFEKFMSDQLTDIRTDVRNLKTRLYISNKQVESLVTMNCGDKLWSMVKCGHLKVVRDRTLTDEEKEFIRT